MKLHEAIEVLKQHQKWRTSNNDTIPPTNPVTLSKAITKIIKIYENSQTVDKGNNADN